jgi:hypothetical protein
LEHGAYLQVLQPVFVFGFFVRTLSCSGGDISTRLGSIRTCCFYNPQWPRLVIWHLLGIICWPHCLNKKRLRLSSCMKGGIQLLGRQLLLQTTTEQGGIEEIRDGGLKVIGWWYQGGMLGRCMSLSLVVVPLLLTGRRHLASLVVWDNQSDSGRGAHGKTPQCPCLDAGPHLLDLNHMNDKIHGSLRFKLILLTELSLLRSTFAGFLNF